MGRNGRTVTVTGRALAWRTGLWIFICVFWLYLQWGRIAAARALHIAVRGVTWVSLWMWVAMLVFWTALGLVRWRQLRQRESRADVPSAG